MEQITINILVGLLGVFAGSTVAVGWISKQVNKNALMIAEDRRDIKTAFVQIEDNKLNVRSCQMLHAETLASVKAVIDQNQMLIHQLRNET